MKIIAMAIEKELSIPLKIKINPDIMADITNKVPINDILLKRELVSFIQYKIIISETITIKIPFVMCANTSIPPE
jgi:hypothetical protein